MLPQTPRPPTHALIFAFHIRQQSKHRRLSAEGKLLANSTGSDEHAEAVSVHKTGDGAGWWRRKSESGAGDTRCRSWMKLHVPQISTRKDHQPVPRNWQSARSRLLSNMSPPLQYLRKTAPDHLRGSVNLSTSPRSGSWVTDAKRNQLPRSDRLSCAFSGSVGSTQEGSPFGCFGFVVSHTSGSSSFARCCADIDCISRSAFWTSQ